MYKLIEAFSKIFFLPNFPIPGPRVKLLFNWVHNLAEIDDGYGFASHQTFDHNSRILIEMDSIDHSEEIGVDSFLAYVCSILLHELCHAYFMAYSCDGKHDAPEEGECSREGEALWVPGNGHCVAWFHLAADVELAFLTLLADDPVRFVESNLAVLDAYLDGLDNGEIPLSAQEWKRFLAWWPGAVALFSHLDGEEVCKLREYLEQDPAVMQVWIEAGENWRPAEMFARQ